MIVWRQSGWLLVGECFPLLVNIKCYTTSDPGNFMRNIFGKLHICTRRFHFHACTTNRFDINREGTWFFNRIRSTSCCCHRNQHIFICFALFLTSPSCIPTLSSLFPTSICSGQITGIALGVPASLISCLALFFLGVLYHRGLAIRRKRAMRRYLESGEVGPPP